MRRTASAPRHHIDWWIYVVLLLAVAQVALFTTLHIRPGLLGVFLWYVGPLGLGLLALVALFIGGIWSAVHRPLWTGWRGVGYLGLAAIMTISAKAYRVYPSSYDDSPSAVRFRLPLDGPVTVAWGGGSRDVNYHVVAPDQRWAYDLLVTTGGKSFKGTGARLENYYAYGRPIVAPAAGRVHSIVHDEPDGPLGRKWSGETVVGNHIVLEVAPNAFLFIAHLQPGSVAVEAGDRVSAGQLLGLVGNSGNSSEPHVHLHLQDTPRLHLGEGIPFYFHGYREGGSVVARGVPTGGVTDSRFVGKIVEHVSSPP